MTKVVAVGIGDDVRLSELHIMASRPHSLTVTMVPDFSNLTKADVEKDIMRAICGKHRLYVSAIYSYQVRKQTQIHLIITSAKERVVFPAFVFFMSVCLLAG